MSEILKDSTMSPLWHSLLGVSYDSQQLIDRTTTMQPVAHTVTEIRKNDALAAAQISNDLGIHRTNFIWTEDPADELPVKY